MNADNARDGNGDFVVDLPRSFLRALGCGSEPEEGHFVGRSTLR